MNPSAILYIDGHGVSVTRHTLKTKYHSYPLREIKRPTLSVMQPKRFFAILAIMWGMVLITSNYVNATSEEIIPAFVMNGKFFSSFYMGAAMIVAGLLGLVLMRERYALQIVTADGRAKNILVNRRKEYIYKIVHTLHTVITENKYANKPVIQKVNSEMLESHSYISLN